MSEVTGPLVDDEARRRAVDPTENVVLEASAGTGKTRVLVERYLNLLRAGVDPDNILAITFSRKAAAEMRERIVDRLREASRTSELDLVRWRDLRDRLSDIAISTIDAFCLSLLREFPLEADIDPGFSLADETEVPRLVEESLDRALRVCRALARDDADDADVALVFAQLGERRLRIGLSALLERRLVAPGALRRYLTRGPRDLTSSLACTRAASMLRAAAQGIDGGVEPFLADGPLQRPKFAMLAEDIRSLCRGRFTEEPLARTEQAAFRAFADRVGAYFLTQAGQPRNSTFLGTGFRDTDCRSKEAWRRHRQRASRVGPLVRDAVRAFRRDLNVVQSRGIWRMFAVAVREYHRALDARALVDFSGVLERAVQLLKGMDEFAESRYHLESRYRHVLVDEFQDTSRAQWELVSQLVKSWGEGRGAADDSLAPTIFIVGDRKQSIYGFRDADTTVLDDAARFVEALRPAGDPRRAITVSFRAVPALQGFVNDLFAEIVSARSTPGEEEIAAGRFRYDHRDRFPVEPSTEDSRDDVLGIVIGDTVQQAASRVALEIVRLVGTATVRDRTSGVARAAQAGDVAILFRTRESHREFERALEARGIRTYVYKGLGFFEADEVQDVVSLLRYLADPFSDLRAAALLRSRVVRLSDPALAQLAPDVASALQGPLPAAATRFGAEDVRALERARAATSRWLPWVDRLTPTELLRTVLAESSYALEMRGRGYRQARENLKRLRAMIRRFQNRGYATLARVVDHLDALAEGDEANATIDAQDAVSLMTVHAAKGLEFPIVFLVNVGRGTGTGRAPIRVAHDRTGEAHVAVADYQSEADLETQAREREETTRLLYVAVTRARDRLYFSTSVVNGQARMGPGGLGAMLPQSLRAVLASAVPTERDGQVTWNGRAGRVHRFLVPADQPAPATSSDQI